MLNFFEQCLLFGTQEYGYTTDFLTKRPILVLQEYSFQITLRQQWNDNRLAFKNKLRDGMAGKRSSILPKVTTNMKAAFLDKAEPSWGKKAKPAKNAL